MVTHLKVVMALVAFLVVGTIEPEREFAQEPERNPSTGTSSEYGDLEIDIEHTTLVEGTSGELTYTFTARQPVTLFNPSFDSWKGQPGKVTISNADGVVLDYANVYCTGSGSLVGVTDWVRIPSRCRIGARISFGFYGCPRRDRPPPGRYSVQLILFKHFVSEPPRTDREMNHPLDRTPLCTSNPVTIDYVRPVPPDSAPN